MPVQFKLPKANHKQKGKVLIARGSVPDEGARQATGVTAVLSDESVGSNLITRVMTSVRRKGMAIEWHVSFTGPFHKDHKYLLKVTPFFGKDAGTAGEHRFEIKEYSPVKDEKVRVRRKAQVLQITLNYPAGDMSITAEEAETFIAFGGLQDGHSLVSRSVGHRPGRFHLRRRRDLGRAVPAQGGHDQPRHGGVGQWRPQRPAHHFGAVEVPQATSVRGPAGGPSGRRGNRGNFLLPPASLSGSAEPNRQQAGTALDSTADPVIIRRSRQTSNHVAVDT